jgi:hypothetical protein
LVTVRGESRKFRGEDAARCAEGDNGDEWCWLFFFEGTKGRKACIKKGKKIREKGNLKRQKNDNEGW